MLTHHVVLSGRVLNTGSRAVFYPQGCTFKEPIRVRVFDSTGAEVLFRDPRFDIECGDVTLTLDSNAEIRDEVGFYGTVYVPNGTDYDIRSAPSGEYTVRIEFTFDDGHSASQTATRTGSFYWNAQATCGT